jgi:hypothetical protein
MANPHRGQVALQAGERAYALSFSVNAICELEDALGQPVNQIARGMETPDQVRMSTIRALLWAALRDHHEDVGLKQAGEIATEAGVPAVMEAIGEAFRLAFPDQEASGSPRPRKAKAA